MTVPLLLDEHIEHEVYHRLTRDGHDVTHVHFHETLRRGDEDEVLADHSLEYGCLIVTYDDDFVQYYDQSEYWGVLFFADDSWSPQQVGDTTQQILDLYDESTLQQMNVVGQEWL